MFVVRVWLPDQPGALGAVASRVGAVRGDVVGIEIIDRGAGRAVDELTIELDDEGLIDLLVQEIHEIEGADVEDVRPLGHHHEDLSVTALRVGADVALAAGSDRMAEAMVKGAMRVLRPDWVAVVDVAAGTLVAGTGEGLPNATWICGFVLGATSDGSNVDLDQLAWSALPSMGWTMVVSREHLPLRGRERALLEGLTLLG